MSKSIEEFREDLRQIKEDLYSSAENMDTRLVASYLDRLIVSLDGIAERIESIEIGLEELSNSEECCGECCVEAPAAPAKKSKAMKAPAKKAKKAAKKRRK